MKRETFDESMDEEYFEEEDFEEGDFEEEDFEEDLSVENLGQAEAADKKLVFIMILLGIIIFAAAVTIFAVSVKRSRQERETAEIEMGSWEAIGEETPKKQENSEMPERETVNAGENDDKQQEAESTFPPASEVVSDAQTEVSVGALDDAQDPQSSAAAGNESAGAAVTVAPLNSDETTDLTMGIDVSKYQGTIDWQKVKASGVEFAMIRVGYRARSTGEIFEDPTARYNMQEAQAAGIKLGVYFFSSAVTKEEARAEAAFTKDIIAKYKITYPVAYNCEDFQSSDSRQYGLGSAERTQLACAFLDEISAGGYTPMFYASKGELEGSAQWDTQALASRYKIWVAQYPEKPYPQTAASAYSGSHDMWQYTSQGTVDGIPGKVDVNLAYFGYAKEADARDETPAQVVEADPEVGIIFTEVNETVTAKQETNLRTKPSTIDDGTIADKLVHGDTAVRTGIGHNGWSRIIYNGQTYYAVSSYLTTDMNDTGHEAPPQGPVYTPVNESVTAKIETNLRTEPGTASGDTIVGVLHNGEVLVRTGIGDNGWSQLDYNGQTVYAVSSFLKAAE